MFKFVAKLIGSIALAGGILYALLVAFGCAAAPKPITQPEEVKTEVRAANPCMVIGETYCAKGELCGSWLFQDCVVQFVPVCADMKNISPREAEACALAIIDEPCDGSMPEECYGIAVHGEGIES